MFEISEKKVPVYLDDTDSNDVQWKVDTTSFGITSDVTIRSDGSNSSTIKEGSWMPTALTLILPH